jgi:predicted CXXCH cytochrome family protein
MRNKFIDMLKSCRNSMLVIVASLTVLLFAPLATAQAIHRTSDFNHMKTGFPLTGVHINVDCETCHVGGRFKGTPTACAGCHSPGRSVVAPHKPANHIPTNAACETCHTNTVSFLGTRFNHMGVQPRACITCHNGGTFAPGKPAKHVLTNASCDSCHRSSSWIPAGYDHIGVVPGTCINCHNGSTAKGKPSFHITSSNICSDCHKNFITFYGAAFAHNGTNTPPGFCGTCHNGQSLEAKQRPGNHIPYSGNACDSCHPNTGYTSFAGSLTGSSVTMHGYNTVLTCKTCHTSNTYLGVTGDKKAVNHETKTPTPTDCTDAGCHKPGPNSGTRNSRGTAYISW